MKNLDPKVSIVIPAYNEESHIADCLRAISMLNEAPYEVILVDNNSNDNTVKIAEQFLFVKILRQEKQGVVYARDLGFDAAKGDLIARIDADTLLPPDWIEKLEVIFKDSNVNAVSGSFHFYDIGISRALDAVEAYLRGWMARRMARSGRIFLNASNMAIRKSAWDKVRAHVCRVKGIHEDLDLALHLYDENLKVIYEPKLKANVSARRIDSGFMTLFKYALISPYTYKIHNAYEHVYMYPEIAIAMFFYPLLRVAYRGYDQEIRKVSLKQLLLSQTETRVNPADFIQS